MCAACGVPGHVAEPDVLTAAPPTADLATSAAPAAPVARFAALRNRDCRPYLIGTGLSMMADNVEHVITYWVLWQTFHSPALTGFQVISHWVPFLLCSVWFGSLADRHDCRRVIQAAQALFMLVSVAWGVLFLTGTLRIWEACVLLVLHGLAGSLWGPGEQAMLHDFVGRDEPAERGAAQCDVPQPGHPVRAGGRLRAAPGARADARHLRQRADLPAAHAVPVPHEVHRAHPRGRCATSAGRGAGRAAGAARRQQRPHAGEHGRARRTRVVLRRRLAAEPRCRSSPTTSARAARARRTASCCSRTAPAESSAACCWRRPAASAPRCGRRWSARSSTASPPSASR
nr:MFS transporter [Angustibacter aerolatus]